MEVSQVGYIRFLCNISDINNLELILDDKIVIGHLNDGTITPYFPVIGCGHKLIVRSRVSCFRSTTASNLETIDIISAEINTQNDKYYTIILTKSGDYSVIGIEDQMTLCEGAGIRVVNLLTCMPDIDVQIIDNNRKKQYIIAKNAIYSLPSCHVKSCCGLFTITASSCNKKIMHSSTIALENNKVYTIFIIDKKYYGIIPMLTTDSDHTIIYQS